MKSSGADVRLTCTPKCFGVYVMASCTALFQVLLVFTSPPSHMKLRSRSLSHSLADRKKGKGGVDEQELEHREFFVCLFHMVSFKHAY